MRVLVVDDNTDSSSSLAEVIRFFGHDVDTSSSGLDAIARAEALRPDLILMDVGMPELNGLEATRRIRAQDWGRSIAIVALTGWSEARDHASSAAAGCDAHLVKPVEFGAVERILQDIAARAASAPVAHRMQEQ